MVLALALIIMNRYWIVRELNMNYLCIANEQFILCTTIIKPGGRSRVGKHLANIGKIPRMPVENSSMHQGATLPFWLNPFRLNVLLLKLFFVFEASPLGAFKR